MITTAQHSSYFKRVYTLMKETKIVVVDGLINKYSIDKLVIKTRYGKDFTKAYKEV